MKASMMTASVLLVVTFAFSIGDAEAQRRGGGGRVAPPRPQRGGAGGGAGKMHPPQPKAKVQQKAKGGSAKPSRRNRKVRPRRSTTPKTRPHQKEQREKKERVERKERKEKVERKERREKEERKERREKEGARKQESPVRGGLGRVRAGSVRKRRHRRRWQMWRNPQGHSSRARSRTEAHRSFQAWASPARPLAYRPFRVSKTFVC